MDNVHAGDVAQALLIEADHVREKVRVCAEPVELVAAYVVGDSTVPICEIHLGVVVHFAILAPTNTEIE
jgi:hypothetical protein